MRREWQPTFDAMAMPFSAIAGAYATLEDDVLQLYFVFGCVCEVGCWHFMTIFVRVMLSRKSPVLPPLGSGRAEGGHFDRVWPLLFRARGDTCPHPRFAGGAKLYYTAHLYGVWLIVCVGVC